jgi:hypothetical protein
MAQATQDHLAEDVERLRESDRQLASDVKGLAAVQAELRLIIWRIIAGVAILGIPSVIGFAFQAGALKNAVESNAVQAEKRFDQVEKNVRDRFDQLEKRMNKTDAKVEQQLAAILQRLDQGVPKPK